MVGMQSLLGYLCRCAWVVLGLVCVAIGAVGIVVPGLPTTVFFIAAAACFTRSSPRLERWVLGLPRIGTAVSRYRAGLGMPARAKFWAIGMMIVFTSISIVVVDLLAFRIGISIVAAIGVWYVSKRVPTTPLEALEPISAR